MRPIIEFKPLNELPQRFDLESSVVISRGRNAVGKATIALPNVRAIRDLTSYNEIEISYNDVVLFDGKTQQKTNNGQKIIFQANDWLWDFERKKRTFTQSTNNLRPDQLFINAFDENEVFDYLTGDWETYNTPWIDDFDARTHVIPADANLDYTDALNSENLSGKGFMDFLANASYLQDIYRYFYWFNNIDNDRFLFFQPDGWGKIWDKLDFTTLNYSEISEYLFNNIVVWGKSLGGYYPPNGDNWTESSLDGWYVSSGNLSLSAAQVKTGYYSLYNDCAGINSIINHGRYTGTRDGSNMNMENLISVHYWVYKGGAADTTVNYFGLVCPNAGNSYYSNNVALAHNAWTEVTLTLAEIQANSIGAPDITDCAAFTCNLSETGVADLTDGYYIDNLYFLFKPFRSENTSTATGYDSTSDNNYGFRSTDLHIPWYTKISDCNTMASNIVNYLKDPHYSAKIKIPGFTQLDLNENIQGSFFDTELTLPIDKLTWVFKPNEEVITTADLGIKRLTLEKVLQKLFGEVETERYDRGQTHHVY